MDSLKKFKGIITALATPFKEGSVDESSFKRLLEFQALQEIDGFVLNGTTGESPTLLPGEVEKLFEWSKLKFPNKPLILGVGGNSTQKTLENIKLAESLKAGALLIVVPYYNKPPQAGLLKHFKTLAEKSLLPVILYNVPARTGVGLSLESTVELSRHPNIIGIKEASGDLELGKKIIEKADKNFLVLSGDDETGFKLCALGALGIVSVISHILGKEMKSFFQQIKKGKAEEALREYDQKYGELLKSIYSESNPIGIKKALKLIGVFDSAELRSPLVALGEEKTKKLTQDLKRAGFLK